MLLVQVAKIPVRSGCCRLFRLCLYVQITNTKTADFLSSICVITLNCFVTSEQQNKQVPVRIAVSNVLSYQSTIQRIMILSSSQIIYTVVLLNLTFCS